MAFGPGKYDELATYVREKAEATCVVVVILGGNKGVGFEQQIRASPAEFPQMLDQCARALRQVADAMQTDARRFRQRTRGN
jgi:hypothetical protein